MWLPLISAGCPDQQRWELLFKCTLYLMTNLQSFTRKVEWNIIPKLKWFIVFCYWSLDNGHILVAGHLGLRSTTAYKLVESPLSNQVSSISALAPYNDDTPSSLGVFHDDKLFPIKPEQFPHCSPAERKILFSFLVGYWWFCMAVVTTQHFNTGKPDFWTDISYP